MQRGCALKRCTTFHFNVCVSVIHENDTLRQDEACFIKGGAGEKYIPGHAGIALGRKGYVYL